MDDDTVKQCFAIAGFTILICFAVYMGHDGALVGGALGILGAVFGYSHAAVEIKQVLKSEP